MDFIFLHGGEQGDWIWDETIEALHKQEPDRHRTLALSIPGCGAKRHVNVEGMAFLDIIPDLAADVAASGMQDAVLIGHSQAGSVLPRLARALPDTFKRLIYVSCTAPVPGTGLKDEVFGLHRDPGAPLHGILGNPDVPFLDQMRAAFCNDMSAQEADAFIGKLGADHWPISSLDWAGYTYDPLTCPATYVVCLADMIQPPSGQRVFAARFGCDRIVDIDAGHQVQNTRPHGPAEIVRQEGRFQA